MSSSIVLGIERFVRDYNDAHLCVPVVVDGREWLVEIPVGRIRLIYHQAAREEGVTLPRALGSNCRTVGGLFSSLKKAYKRVTRKVKKALPKVARRALHHVEKTAEWGAGKVIDAHKMALNVVKSDAFAAGLVGASFLVPALAPAAAAVVAARAMIAKVEAGKRLAEGVKKGIVQMSPAVAKIIGEGKQQQANAKTMVSAARSGNNTAMQFMGALRQLKT